MIACTAMVQAGQIAPATVERLEGDLDAFTRDAFDAPATIAWVEVEAGNGFTKGEPSTTSVVSVSAPAALEQGRRVELLDALCALWMDATQCALDEVVAVVADPRTA